MASDLMIGDFIAYLGTTQWLRISIVILILCLGIGLGAGLAIASNEARQKADDDYAERFALFNSWQVVITSTFSRTESVAGALAAFATSGAKIVANMSAPPSVRRHTINNDTWVAVAKNLFRDSPGITVVNILPGGVISQGYSPTKTLNYGFDQYPTAAFHDTYNKMMRDGKPISLGPNPLQSRPGMAVYAFYPVFVNSTVSPETFWGAALVTTEIDDLLASVNITSLVVDSKMDFVMWYQDLRATNFVVVGESNPSRRELVINEGMRMRLPIGEATKVSFLGMYPQAGVVSPSMTVGTIVGVVLATAAGTALVFALLFFSLYLRFLYRHRRAPSSTSHSAPLIYTGVFTLRGAQSIADRAPLEAVKLFAAFNQQIRTEAAKFGCYAVSDIGDRSVYVVSKTPAALLDFAKVAVSQNTFRVGGGGVGIGARGRMGSSLNLGRLPTTPAAGGPSPQTRSFSTASPSGSPSPMAAIVSRSRTSHSVVVNAATTSPNAAAGLDASMSSRDVSTSHFSVSSFVGNVVCRPSAAIHVIPAAASRAYDPAHDVFFFGTAATLSKLCQALDHTLAGEVVWTRDVKINAPDECAAAAKESSKGVARRIGGSGGEGRTDNENDDDDDDDEDENTMYLTNWNPPTIAIHKKAIISKKKNATNNNNTNKDNENKTSGSEMETTDDESYSTSKGDRKRSDEASDDPSAAMAMLGDAYVTRMAVIVGRGKKGQSKGLFGMATHNKKDGERAEGADKNANSGNGSKTPHNSADTPSTMIVRNATILHIELLFGLDGSSTAGNNKKGAASSTNGSEVRPVFDAVRKIIAKEKGTVISAHGSTIVAAFNLLSPGGHHQLRAAEAVNKLRAALQPSFSAGGGGVVPFAFASATRNNYSSSNINSANTGFNVPFVCSIHHGKVCALVVDGLVMCTGDAVVVGKALLQKAIALRRAMPRMVKAYHHATAPHHHHHHAIKRNSNDDHHLQLQQGGGGGFEKGKGFNFNNNNVKMMSVVASTNTRSPMAVESNSEIAINISVAESPTAMTAIVEDDVSSPLSPHRNINFNTIRTKNAGDNSRSDSRSGGVAFNINNYEGSVSSVRSTQMLQSLGSVEGESVLTVGVGLCLLLCANEVSIAFDCEAIDVCHGAIENCAPSFTPIVAGTTTSPQQQALQPPAAADPAGTTADNNNNTNNADSNDKDRNAALVAAAVIPPPSSNRKIVYRLGPANDSNVNKPDEWMYSLQENENDCQFNVGNAIFVKVAVGNLTEAAAMWAKLKEENCQRCENDAFNNNDEKKKSNGQFPLSVFAWSGLEHLITQ